MMIVPARAPVSPRILSGFSGIPILLEDEVRDCLTQQPDAKICVHGLRGTGKTFALNHLAAVLTDFDRVRYFDDAMPDECRVGGGSDAPVVFSVRVPAHASRGVQVYRLAPWSEDDLIEYLLAEHREQCGSVIRRLHASDDMQLLGGVPELCRIVLDYLAEHSHVQGVRDSVDSILRTRVRSGHLHRRIQEHCRDLLVEPTAAWTQLRRWLTGANVAESEIKILRHFPVQVLLSAEILVRDLTSPGNLTWSPTDVPRELVDEAGVRVARDIAAKNRLEEVFPDAEPQTMPLIASILHRAVEGWRPPPAERYYLRAAELSGASWRGLDLHKANLTRARLDGADLRQADLAEADLNGALLRKACLARANLDHAVVCRADLTGADLTRVVAKAANFEHSIVVGAECEGANFRDSNWGAVDMSDSNFVGADFTGAELDEAVILRADFSNAIFDHAALIEVPLLDALLLGASFRHALLQRANFECMILPDVDFSGANLNRARMTGSVIPDGSFRGAFLQHAELADISWEHADLSGADLRGARFHAGTTRTGIRVGGQPSHWDHPPIYPDDEQALDYLPPESMRKANLCGADLRGAIIDGVDFYLVDLRHAKYDADQAEYLRRSGAILQSHA